MLNGKAVVLDLCVLTHTHTRTGACTPTRPPPPGLSTPTASLPSSTELKGWLGDSLDCYRLQRGPFLALPNGVGGLRTPKDGDRRFGGRQWPRGMNKLEAE